MRILIVEDDPISRIVIERSLQKSGYDPVAVDNINTALALVLGGDIHFVITDWLMPGGQWHRVVPKNP